MTHSHNYHSRLQRVTHHNPCPICDKPDWCGVAEDGSIAICMRVESDHPTKNEGWLHILKDRPQRQRRSYRKTYESENSKRANPTFIDEVYRQIRAELKLESQHRTALEKRGLTQKEIRKLGYRSLPEGLGRLPLVNHLTDRFGKKLLSVPGFYLTEKNRIWLAGKEGLLIPCVNVDRHIVGAQVKDNKYRWLSAPKSKRKRGGVSSGTPIHVAGRDSDSRTIWLTEGILKADIAALKLDHTVIGIAGVTAWNRDELKATLEKMYAREVIIALDADKRSNKQVRRAEKKLCKYISDLGYQVYVAEWDENDGKGIDDLLVNAHQPEIHRYYPPVNPKDMKTIGGQKRVRRIPLSEEISRPQPQNVDTLRDMMHEKIRHFAQFASGGALLVKGTQGLSKSTGTVAILDELWQDNILRPVFASPRHDLIGGLIPDSWQHIRPRKPRSEKFLEMTPQQGYQYIKDTIRQAQLERELLNLNECGLLCHHHRRANAIGAKRWNVVKNLCVTDCQVGKDEGLDACPYHMQYRSPRAIATVHETLFIPNFCDQIFGNEQLQFHNAARQVCVIDEPNPSKFVDTVNISPDDLAFAIVDAWDKDLKALLELVQRASQNIASRLRDGDLSDRRHIIGREVMQMIVDLAGGEDELDALLSNAKAEHPSKHEKVIVGIDAFIGDTRKAYEVIIGGERRFIPKAFSDPIDNESIKVVKGYAVSQELPIISHFDAEDDEDIPLNFASDLLKALNREFGKYQAGQPYNSALVFTAKGSTPIVRLNLRKELAVPKSAPFILLDAQGNADLLSRLLRREIETWKASIAPDTAITQLIDGAYGISSLWNKKTDAPKSSLKRLLSKVVFPIVAQNPADVLIVTWKKVADYLRNLQDEGDLEASVGIEHYGNIEGSNEHEHRQTVILLGTPQISPRDLEEMAHALFQTDEQPISMDTAEMWEGYAYRDSDGNGYEVKVRRYKDERVELLSRLFKEDELIQAAHRIRPLLHSGREIYLLTSLPIDDLAPTRLTTLNDLASGFDTNPAPVNEKGKLTQDFFNDFTKGYLAENKVIWLEPLKAALRQTMVKLAKGNINGENDQRQCSCDLPSDSTLKRWLKALAIEEGWNRSQVTVDRRKRENGGGATWIVVYHEDELDEYQVMADYALAMDIDIYRDKVTVVSQPWTEWDYQEVVVPFRQRTKRQSTHPPPQRE